MFVSLSVFSARTARGGKLIYHLDHLYSEAGEAGLTLVRVFL